MIKILINIFVTVAIFASALYTGMLSLLTTTITTVNADFISYIPLEYRIGLYLMMLGLFIALIRAFFK